MTTLVPIKKEGAAMARFAVAGLLIVCTGIFFAAGAGAESPAKVGGAVKSTQVADAVAPVSVKVQGVMKPEAPSVAGASNPASVVAATPISIPRPIQLDKITLQELPAAIAKAAQNASLSLSGSPNDMVRSAEVTGINGNEVTLRVRYQYDAARPAPIYAGAFIYDAQGESVNAGYKPAIAGRPNGFVDITLVLPDEPFRSSHIVAFFMESGRPVFMNERFKFPYAWADGSLEEVKGARVALSPQQPAAVLQSQEEFCEAYADAAVEQCRLAMSKKLPGIVPPVWSDDGAHHYNWCLTASRDEVKNGQSLRQSYLDQHLSASTPPLMPPPVSSIGMGQAGKVSKNMGVAGAVKSSPNKQLDPGLGP